ncbi:MAG: septum formation initiator family protein [Bacteroidia bacterium]|nr:septum formation initiator family protein [Bacteroidia bacterium]
MSSPWYKNRYVLVFAALAIWLTFFDQNNFVYQYKLGKQIEELEKEKTFYEKEIQLLKEQREALNTDEEMLERYAREQFLMKRPNEDLFLLKEE